MKIDKTATAKNIAGVVVRLGTGTIVGSIVANNTPSYEDRTRVQRVTIPVAGFVIGGMAAEKTRAFSDKLIDEAVSAFNRKSESDETTTAQ